MIRLEEVRHHSVLVVENFFNSCWLDFRLDLSHTLTLHGLFPVYKSKMFRSERVLSYVLCLGRTFLDPELQSLSFTEVQTPQDLISTCHNMTTSTSTSEGPPPSSVLIFFLHKDLLF